VENKDAANAKAMAARGGADGVGRKDTPLLRLSAPLFGGGVYEDEGEAQNAELLTRLDRLIELMEKDLASRGVS
jgi:hypothetical protein